MSAAALQVPVICEACEVEERSGREKSTAGKPVTRGPEEPDVSLAFYRRHTEKLLRRYLYASMQVGRAPAILADPVARGYASSRPIRSFEDAVIFVLDMEKCLGELTSLDQALLSRIVLQEYTQAEAAPLLGMSVRAVGYKFPLAVDRLTEKLLKAEVLVLPD
jgi:hypothetical protein